jgi:hypothetical protein
MRVSFSTETAAQAAVSVLAAYGYSARRCDHDVVTDCPTLLALPALERRVGLAEIDRLDLANGDWAPEPARAVRPPGREAREGAAA